MIGLGEFGELGGDNNTAAQITEDIVKVKSVNDQALECFSNLPHVQHVLNESAMLICEELVQSQNLAFPIIAKEKDLDFLAALQKEFEHKDYSRFWESFQKNHRPYIQQLQSKKHQAVLATTIRNMAIAFFLTGKMPELDLQFDKTVAQQNLKSSGHKSSIASEISVSSDQMQINLTKNFKKAAQIFGTNPAILITLKSTFDVIVEGTMTGRSGLAISVDTYPTLRVLKHFVQKIEQDTSVDLWRHVQAKKQQILKLNEKDQETTLSNLITLGFIQSQGALNEMLPKIKADFVNDLS